VVIQKGVKVLCFDTLLEVLILKNLGLLLADKTRPNAVLLLQVFILQWLVFLLTQSAEFAGLSANPEKVSAQKKKAAGWLPPFI
jgi:hypothetical protein